MELCDGRDLFVGAAGIPSRCSRRGAGVRAATSEPDKTGTDYFVTFAARECPTYNGHRGEQGAQQHPGEPERPRPGQPVPDG